jgi:hypothetical protein
LALKVVSSFVKGLMPVRSGTAGLYTKIRGQSPLQEARVISREAEKGCVPFVSPQSAF